jgi:flavin reductase (DIM6/NTAB) family NADH-FMN oxidoreductase RutF
MAMGRFATGVTVITVKRGEEMTGMTASSVASLSLNPPLLLVCINKHLPTHAAIERSMRFGVNVLGEGDERVALRFARPAKDKFAGLRVDLEHDTPLLRTAIARFVCDVRERLPGGDHSIFIGEIRHCEHVPGRRPLLYFGSRFGAIQESDYALDYGSNLWALTGML